MLSQPTADTALRKSLHGQWTSRFAFILAVTGSAVGLGNIWKFPYIAGQNGGGAFVVVYLLCVVLIGMPVMMSEILIGRRGRRNPVATMALLGEEEGSSRHWRLVGLMGVLAGIFILSYYSVVAGWTLAYTLKSVTGQFSGASATEVSQIFAKFKGDWRLVALSHTVFMGLTVFVVARCGARP
jgi:NSS family neurotransmitter:Na+ symporter